MVSHSGRYVITYNGEIYNAPSLRQELENFGNVLSWVGHSDTEVMLACFEAWGLHQSIQRFTGMFAFALWDQQECELHLVRDRLGIKPLYFGWQQGTLLFGSELKALRIHPSFCGRLIMMPLPCSSGTMLCLRPTPSTKISISFFLEQSSL